MAVYATIQDVKDYGSMPAEDIDNLESLYPGLTLKLSEAISSLFDARLGKRYAAPFASPYPYAIVLNVARQVAWRLWLKRGFNPKGEMDASIRQDYEDSETWLKEASNSQTGLIELPMRQDLAGSNGITRSGPMVYSETSPYKWADVQKDISEDYK
jgi:phage gp36-like protein